MDISNFECLYNEDEIESKIKQIARKIDEKYKNEKIVFICVLKGAVVFYCKLLGYLETKDVELDFIQVKSYVGTCSSGKVDILKDINTNLKDKCVIIIEDIIDTGITANFLNNYFKDKGAKEIVMCSLLQKPSKLTVDLQMQTIVGFEIEDKFIIGYGLDLDEKYRNLREILVLKEDKKDE